jgi:PAS domain S-box-containing protein
MRIWPLQRYGFSVRAHVTGVAIAIAIPGLIFGGFLASRSAALERAKLEQTLEQYTREIATDIDREINAARYMLATLASSPFLQTGELQAFHKQVQALSEQLNIQIVMRDPYADEQVINSETAWDAPRQRGAAPEIREAELPPLARGDLHITNVFFARIVQRHVVAVRTPVYVAGEFKYLLGVTIPADRFRAILDGAHLCSECLGAIVDRKGRIVGRSLMHSALVGTQVLSNFTTEAAGSSGVNVFKGRADVTMYWTWRRSDTTGWFVSVGVPESALSAPSKAAIASYGAACVLLLLLAIMSGYGLGGRISRTFGVLGIDRQPTREEFRILFESAPDGVVVINEEGRILLLNERLETKFGYGRGELIGKSVEILIPERFREGHLALRHGFSRNPEARPMGAGSDLFGRRKDGSEFPIEIGLNPISTHAGNFVMATVVDITRRKQAAEKLSATLTERDDLRRRFMQAQEEERLRLAHELHDQTGQTLTAVMLEMKSMERTVGEHERNRLRLVRMQLEQMGQTLHHVAWELRPASIDELGMVSAISNYLSEWKAQYDIETDFHCTDSKIDELTTEVRTTLYRVAQEALTNVARHAHGATHVSIVIECVGGSVRLVIEDNGCGFDVAQQESPLSDRRGLGLPGMRERLSLVGGTLEIESAINVGTTVFARIPLERAREAA